MGGRDIVPLDDCGGGETGEIGFAQYKDSDTLWVWPKNTHLDKKKFLHRVSIPKASTHRDRLVAGIQMLRQPGAGLSV